MTDSTTDDSTTDDSTTDAHTSAADPPQLHRPTVQVQEWNGRSRAACSCGWGTGWHTDWARAASAAMTHYHQYRPRRVKGAAASVTRRKIDSVWPAPAAQVVVECSACGWTAGQLRANTAARIGREHECTSRAALPA